MFRPSRSSSGPPRKQIQELLFLKGLRMIYYVETCRPDMYTIVYKIKVALLTDVFCLYVITLRGGKRQKYTVFISKTNRLILYSEVISI